MSKENFYFVLFVSFSIVVLSESSCSAGQSTFSLVFAQPVDKAQRSLIEQALFDREAFLLNQTMARLYDYQLDRTHAYTLHFNEEIPWFSLSVRVYRVDLVSGEEGAVSMPFSLVVVRPSRLIKEKYVRSLVELSKHNVAPRFGVGFKDASSAHKYLAYTTEWFDGIWVTEGWLSHASTFQTYEKVREITKTWISAGVLLSAKSSKLKREGSHLYIMPGDSSRLHLRYRIEEGQPVGMPLVTSVTTNRHVAPGFIYEQLTSEYAGIKLSNPESDQNIRRAIADGIIDVLGYEPSLEFFKYVLDKYDIIGSVAQKHIRTKVLDE